MKQTILAFLLDMDVANDSVESVNKELSSYTFNGQNINAKCVNVLDEYDQHGILNISVDLDLDKQTDLYEEVCESLSKCISQVEEVHVQEWDIAKKS